MAKGAVRGRPGTRQDAWRGSWRVAVRSAGREVARSRGRSLLIMLLIGLPVFGLCAAGVALTSVTASASESADQRLGAAVASVVPASQDSSGEFSNSEPVETLDGEVFGQVTRGGFAPMDRQRPGALLLADGFTRESPWTQQRVEATVGAPVLPIAVVPLTSVDGQEFEMSFDEFDLPALVADATDPLFGGSGQLTSGRWAQRPSEITVTEVGVGSGLPRSGLLTLTLGAESTEREFRVVGVAKAQAGQTQAAAVLHPSAAPEGTAWEWRVERSAPVHLDEALTWTDYGLSVMSRAVLLDPPPEEQDSAETVTVLVIAMLVLGVLIETMFLAGPAFAISTTRRQRSMALASAQGAGPADLRRQVLGYAVVLATLAAATGAVLGVGIGLGAAVALRRRSPNSFLPLEVPWLPLLAIILVAVLAAALAAWWPARGVTHLDTMAVLRGRTVSRSVGRGAPVLGVVMLVAGAPMAVGGAVYGSGGEYALVAAGALTFFGTVLLIPLLLVGAGRLADRLPTAARLAVRDATRQRGRSTPAVAAIAAAVALVVGFSTVTASSEVAAQLNYQPQVAIGVGRVPLEQWGARSTAPTLADPVEVQSAMAEALPAADVWPVDYATALAGSSPWQETPEGTSGPLWAVYPPDCSADQVALRPAYEEPCGIGANTFGRAWGLGIAVLPMDAFERFAEFDEDSRAALREGAVVLPEERASGAPLRTTLDVPTLSGEVTVVPDSEYETALQPVNRLEKGAISGYVMDTAQFRRAFPFDAAAVMTSSTASSLGVQVDTDHFLVAVPDRSLTSAEAAAATAAMGELGVSFYVERGFEGDVAAQRAIWIALAALGLIALAATIIVTALTTTDNSRDSAVLAAVGGTSRFRRRWASCYALVIAGFGVALGMLVGAGIGLACAWWTTAGGYGFGPDGGPGTGGVISLAWPALGVLALLPLIGALIAWASVRGTPHLLRPTV